MIYDMHKRHSGEHACVSFRQIIMRISSDAGCLEDDVALRAALAFICRIASGFNDTLCASLCNGSATGRRR